MNLKVKFNLILFLVLLVGTSASSFLIFQQLQEDARTEIMTNAKLMLDAALSVRKYTIEQVRPNLDVVKKQREFLPQSVPAYGATEVINYIKANRPEYSYKEAVMNPTNPRDKADDWEMSIINQFRRDPSAKEKTGYRVSETGQSTLWLARPIVIKNEACLACHSTPERAPATMVKKYGEENGFGWQLNKVLGVQLVQVPAGVPLQRAKAAFGTFVGWMIGIFAVSLVLLNVLLHLLVNRRITKLTNITDAVSKGQLKESVEIKGDDEISLLAKAVARMNRSHSKMMDILQTQEKALDSFQKS